MRSSCLALDLSASLICRSSLTANCVTTAIFCPEDAKALPMASRGFVPCEAWTRERAISRSAAPLRHPFSRSSSRLFQSALGAVPVFREDQQCLDALEEFPGRIPKRSADQKQGYAKKVTRSVFRVFQEPTTLPPHFITFMQRLTIGVPIVRPSCFTGSSDCDYH